MRSARLLGSVGLFGAVFAAVACGHDEATPSSELELHAEADPLRGLTYDSGFQGWDGVYSQLQVSTQATLTVDAAAVAVDGPKLAGRPGSGKVSLDAKFFLTGNLEIDLPWARVKYLGPIPGLDAVDLHFSGWQVFDPFALETPATVLVSLPRRTLPDLPIPSLPNGRLSLTIEPTSVLTSTFQATCVANDGTTAEYRGGAFTEGWLAISATLVMDLPGGVASQHFPLAPFGVHVDHVGTELDFGTKPVAGTGDAPVGGALVARKSCEGTVDFDAGTSTSSSGGPVPRQPEVENDPWSVTIDGIERIPRGYHWSDDDVEGRRRHVVQFSFLTEELDENPFVTVSAYDDEDEADAGQGCESGEGIEYEPDDGTATTFVSQAAQPGEPAVACGLAVAQADSFTLKGSFDGAVTGPAGSHRVVLSFDVHSYPF